MQNGRNLRDNVLLVQRNFTLFTVEFMKKGWTVLPLER